MNSAVKSFVDILAKIRCQDHGARVFFHPLKEIVRFHIGPPVAGFADFTPFAEQSFRLIKEDNGIRFFRLVKDAAKVFFGFTHIFAHHAGQVDAVEGKVEGVR